ncbi:peptidyl-tRNA hydrolase domain-containing protein [Saccharata proteae CBS 121410]|uniref:Peptidyl-tRNA hydrolase domain-containing protein n=1 Tax=Saccharata proteae CBS 121410 TaxID=1314787 RepID=A0A9P4LWT4_9PEZI|nr:peptidyl-tRNA hydrolase domain-containing protein [Saccharata proteae CBS 121410]
MLPSIRNLRVIRTVSCPTSPQSWRFFATKKKTETSTTTSEEEDVVAARKWLAQFNPETIPRSLCDISFSRSSGPGGQNVNKVSSKATLRITLSQLLPLLPRLLHSEVVKSRYCTTKTSDVVIQSDDSRKQNDNVQSSLAKLHRMIAEAGEKVVPGETSDAQKERVKNLYKAANASRLKAKKHQSSKKSARRGGFDD